MAKALFMACPGVVFGLIDLDGRSVHIHAAADLRHMPRIALLLLITPPLPALRKKRAVVALDSEVS